MNVNLLNIKAMLIAVGIAAAFPAVGQTVRHYESNVGNFKKISVIDDIDVVYRCNPDSTGFVVYDVAASLADQIQITNKKDKLSISYKKYSDAKEKRYQGPRPVITVYSDFLVSASVDSKTAVLTVLQPAPVPELVLTVVGNCSLVAEGVSCTTLKANVDSGEGTITVTGKCTDANFRIIGTGNIQADALWVKDVTCNMVGIGTVGCCPTDNLHVRGLGDGTVYYRGEPQIKKSGKADIVKL